jgi:uncharacterized membrane protein
MWLWLDLLFLALFLDGALVAKWALDHIFPIPSAPKDGNR